MPNDEHTSDTLLGRNPNVLITEPALCYFVCDFLEVSDRSMVDGIDSIRQKAAHDDEGDVC